MVWKMRMKASCYQPVSQLINSPKINKKEAASMLWKQPLFYYDCSSCQFTMLSCLKLKYSINFLNLFSDLVNCSNSAN